MRILFRVLALSLVFGTVANAGGTSKLSFDGSVTLTSTAEDFLPAGGTTGSFDIVAPSDGSFMPLIGTTGSIKDLSRATSPVGANVNITSFLVFAAAPTTSFDLTRVRAGVFSSAQLGDPPAAGQTATPPGSHYNLVNVTNSSSTLSFTVDVLGQGPLGGAPWLGVFTMVFANRNYQEVMQILSIGQSISAPYSAQFVFNFPEPASASIAVAGLLLTASLRRRRLG